MIIKKKYSYNKRIPSTQISRLDTLRALAVILVVLFHLQPQFIPWGYIGVDMFFTLSGFLMSYLYFRRTDDDFTGSPVKQFIKRRFWRLFPPLIIINLITVTIATLIMAPFHLLETAKSSIASVFLLQNFYFHNQTGYFDTDAIVKPLLHTWSLGVEEQFYILFAVALAIRRWVSLKFMLMVFTGVSLAAWGVVVLGEFQAIQPIHDEPYSSLFFLPQYRIFQFSAGGWAAYTMLSGYRSVKLLGFIALVVAAVIASNKIYAHLSAPMVTLGMCMLMMNSSSLDAVGKVLCVRYLARVSYQLYLVHWPIIVFWQYFTFSEITWIGAILCSFTCIVCADILYRATNWMRLA